MAIVARNLVGIVSLTLGVWAVLLGLGYAVLYPKFASFLQYACPDKASGSTLSRREIDLQQIMYEREILNSKFSALQKKTKAIDRKNQESKEIEEKISYLEKAIKDRNEDEVRISDDIAHINLLERKKELLEELVNKQRSLGIEMSDIIKSLKDVTQRKKELSARLWSIKGGSVIIWDTLQINHPYVNDMLCSLA